MERLQEPTLTVTHYVFLGNYLTFPNPHFFISKRDINFNSWLLEGKMYVIIFEQSVQYLIGIIKNSYQK